MVPKKEMNDRPKKDLIEERAIILLEQALQTDFNQTDRVQLERLIRETCSEDEYVETVIRIALHLSRVTYIGFYSISLNKSLRNEGVIPEEIFPELFQNPYLSEEEKADLIREYELEQKILKDAFLRSLRSPLPEIQFFPSFPDLELETPLEDLYSLSSYREVTKVRQPPYQIQHLLDGGVIKEIPVMELLTSVVQGDHSYSRPALHRIRSKFGVELKMIEAGR